MNGPGTIASDYAGRTIHVAALPELQPFIKASDFVDHVAAALGEQHDSPTAVRVYNELREVTELNLSWDPPSVGYFETYDRNETVEYGACGAVFLVLGELHRRRITYRGRRGDRIDYFLGETRGDCKELLEVKGTDRGSLVTILQQAKAQFMESPYELPGFVGVVRFLSSEIACERIERVVDDT